MTDAQKIAKIEKMLAKWKNQVEESRKIKHWEDQEAEDWMNIAREEYISDLDEILNPKPVVEVDPNQMTVFDYLEELRMEQQEQM